MPKQLDLTPERRSIIDSAYKEWLAYGLSTEPADFGAAEEAVTALYAAIDKPKPYFVKVSSPLGAELYLNLLTKTWGAGGKDDPKKLRGQLRDQLWGQLRDQLWDQLDGQLRDQLRDQLWDQLWGQLGGQLRDQLWGQLGDQLGGQLRDQLWGQLRGQLDGQLRDQLRDQLWDQLWGQLRGQLGGQLRDQLWGQLGDQLGGQLGDQLEGQRQEPLRFMGTWFYGAWDYLWMWLDGGRPVGAVYPARENAMLDAHVTICQSVGWWYPFDDFVILCDRPEILHVDDRVRFHAEVGPAIRYRDGYSLWALGGLPLPGQVIEAPATLTFEQVRDEPNAEIRRHMLDRFAGLRGSAAQGAWLAAGGLKPISEIDITDKMQPSGLSIWRLSHGAAPVTCRLYRADLVDDEPLVLVMVVCTSTAKEVFLRVPPDMTDAGAARDWTFPNAQLAEAIET